MSDSLTVEIREDFGTTASRRLRKSGKIPAILYGHGEENVGLTVSAEEVAAAIRHGSRLVDLTGAVTESALIKEVHWDAFGIEVLHLDFTRTSKTESVEITVLVELRGVAPGTKLGGVVQHQQHELEIVCPAGSIPEKVEANINSLEIGDVITAGELELPVGASLLTDPAEIIVQCVEAEEEREEELEEAAPGEPEVIGRQEEDEEGED